jgi:transglutaminase-like putative cysteine protease
MRYTVRHRTVYHYGQDVSHSCHLAHLLPRETAVQKVETVSLQLNPAPTRRMRRRDYFGNATEWISFDQPHRMLEVVSESVVSVVAPERELPELSLSGAEVHALLEAAADQPARDAVSFIFDSPLTAFATDVADYARRSLSPDRPLLDGVNELMARIHKDFRYDTTVTDASTPVDRVFEIKAGVCQDLAHVGIACLRSLGLAARYVSGYLLTQPPPGQPRLLGADASHAWFSAWIPPFGWVDFDPTNNVRPGEGHVTVGWGRDYADVAPLNGVVSGGGDHVVEVGVDVIPI